MSSFVLALIGGPIGGLVLEAIGMAGIGSKAVASGGAALKAGQVVLRLLSVVEKAKPKLSPEERAEAEAAISDAARYGWGRD